MIGTMDTRIVGVVEPVWVEAQQHIYLVARPLFRLVDLVILHEGFGEMTDRGKVLIFVDDGRIEGHPRMLIEVSADHFPVLGPVVVRIQGGMNSNKALAVFFNKGQHVLLLSGVRRVGKECRSRWSPYH